MPRHPPGGSALAVAGVVVQKKHCFKKWVEKLRNYIDSASPVSPRMPFSTPPLETKRPGGYVPSSRSGYSVVVTVDCLSYTQARHTVRYLH